MLGILLQNVRRNTLTRTRWQTILVGFGWMTSPTQTVSIFFFMRDIFCIKFCIRQSMKRATVLKISKEIERNQRLYKATFEVTKTVHGSQWLEFNFTMILFLKLCNLFPAQDSLENIWRRECWVNSKKMPISVKS